MKLFYFLNPADINFNFSVTTKWKPSECGYKKWGQAWIETTPAAAVCSPASFDINYNTAAVTDVYKSQHPSIFFSSLTINTCSSSCIWLFCLLLCVACCMFGVIGSCHSCIMFLYMYQTNRICPFLTYTITARLYRKDIKYAELLHGLVNCN